MALANRWKAVCAFRKDSCRCSSLFTSLVARLVHGELVDVCRLHVVVTVEQHVLSGLPWRCVGFAVFPSLSQGEGGCSCVNSVT